MQWCSTCWIGLTWPGRTRLLRHQRKHSLRHCRSWWGSKAECLQTSKTNYVSGQILNPWRLAQSRIWTQTALDEAWTDLCEHIFNIVLELHLIKRYELSPRSFGIVLRQHIQCLLKVLHLSFELNENLVSSVRVLKIFKELLPTRNSSFRLFKVFFYSNIGNTSKIWPRSSSQKIWHTTWRSSPWVYSKNTSIHTWWWGSGSESDAVC